MAGKEKEDDGPPVWPVKAATETFIVFDHEFIAAESYTETKTIDVDGYKTVHVLFAPGMDDVKIIMDVDWKFETPDGVEYFTEETSTMMPAIHTFEVKSPTLCITIYNDELLDVDDNTVIVYAQSG